VYETAGGERAGPAVRPAAPLRAALYCRVSTTGQTVENQRLALRSFAVARGWDAVEFVDQGVSGTREKRPALETLLAVVRARRVDVVACVKLDRLARSTHHLVTLAKELEALGVDLVVLDQAIDTTTPSGRLLFHMLAAVAEFERDLIRDRVLAGLKRAKERGTRSGRPVGRPRTQRFDVGEAQRLYAESGSIRGVARQLGVNPGAVWRAVANPSGKAACKPV
jgi:DNA invertase Pin-like site-specific DNA recombinase